MKTIALSLLLFYFPFGIVQSQSKGDITEDLYRKSIFERIDSLIVSKYVYADKAEQTAEQFRKCYRSGTYDTCLNAKSFANKINTDLREITRDKHVNFRVIESSSIGEKALGSLHHSIRYNRIKQKEHTGFYKLQWFDDGGIGYLDLRRFNALDEATELLNAAMVFLKDANAVIIDIRENGGGMGDYLSNYFLKHPTQLTGSYNRIDDYIQECWTTRSVEHQRRTEVPLFILTGRRTFSAAEYFAHDMKVRKRAVLVGDSTGGGSHDNGYFKIDDQFEIYIPIGRAMNPITGEDWEGVGVIPDIVVPDSAALDTALVLAKKAAKEYLSKRETGLNNAVLDMQTVMDRAEALYRSGWMKKADATLDSVIAMGKQQDLISEFFMYVLACNFMSKKDEPVLFGILRKNIELFPQSSSACELMAQTYYNKGDNEKALEYYQRSLDLNPDNRNAENMLKKLKP